MKFFTRGWTHGDMTDEEYESVVPAYWRYIDSLNLPQPVRELAFLNPHDAYILAVEHDPATCTLKVEFRCGDLQIGYFDARLTFTGVTIAPAHLAMFREALRPNVFEVLYDEVGRMGAETFEYRMLLYPVFEVAFSFETVKISRRPALRR